MNLRDLTLLSPLLLSLALGCQPPAAAPEVDAGPDAGPDLAALDSDGDGISDLHEGAQHERDSDGDGTPDYLDADSDDDGLSDEIEAGDRDLATPPVDSDEDDLPDYRDPDSDNDLLDDGTEEALGTDRFDGDSDHDGAPDFVEVGAGTDPIDGGDHPLSRGEAFFILSLGDLPYPRSQVLRFTLGSGAAEAHLEWSEEEGDDGDALPFLERAVAHSDASGCGAGATASDRDGDGVAEAFEGISASAELCWEVIPLQEDPMMAPEEVQRFFARLHLLADGGEVGTGGAHFFILPLGPEPINPGP